MRAFYFAASGLLVASTAQAQLSVRAGTNWSGQTTNFLAHLSGGSSLATSSHAGYQLGVAYCLPVGQRWALVPELQFSRERQQVVVQGGDPGRQFEANYQLASSYFNLPVLLRATWGRVYLEAGPQASLLVGGRGQGSSLTTSPTQYRLYHSQPVAQAATDSYARFDAGACVGLGVHVAAGLGLSVRAYQGLAGRNRAADSSTSALPKGSGQAYRQSLQVAVTYTPKRR